MNSTQDALLEGEANIVLEQVTAVAISYFVCDPAIHKATAVASAVSAVVRVKDENMAMWKISGSQCNECF